MAPGDLVRLSVYGIARDYNKKITMSDPYQIGVITKALLGSAVLYPYRVHWLKTSTGERSGMFLVNSHSRRELKYAV